MLLWTILKVAFKSLFANKLRSFLAMLGIIIGVGAVISMLALAGGAKAQIMDRITAMGTNLLIIRPGGHGRGGVHTGSRENLKLKDAEEILKNLPEVESVAPVVRGSAQVKYFNENTKTNVLGVSLTYFSIRSFEVSSGRAFTSVEENGTARVAVLGENVAKLLFKEQEPLGESIRIKNVNFRVIGILKPKGDQGWFNPDEMILIPYTTAMKQILGQGHLNELDIKVKETAELKAVAKKLEAMLRKLHGIREGGDDDFSIRNQAEIVDMASSVTKTFTILLAGIASISLLVGGIGIMNIMLVTVTERTREIGVRKAIGARDRDILRQFLLEAIIITGFGGIFGIVAGIAAAETVSKMTEYQTVVDINSIILSIAVSATVGIFFGYYPARRAAKLNAIDALRYE
jgi:putative ABC transport system permease protein